jgi:hypothetical protein
VFDTVIIRGGTMFFADPVVAFGSLGRGGRLAMVVSRGPLDKEWIATALTAKAPYLDSVDLEFTDQPQLVGWPEGLSGPSVFADGSQLDHVLAAAGFRAVDGRVLTLPVRSGTDADNLTGYLLAQPEAQALLEGKSLARCPALSRHSATPTHRTPDASAWLVTAQR